MSSALFQLTVNVSLLFPDWLALSIPQRLVYITKFISILQAWNAMFMQIFSISLCNRLHRSGVKKMQSSESASFVR